MKKVMVFGVFDSIHDGHRFFLKEAKREGDYLIAVVARDRIVKSLKGKQPKHSLQERTAGLKREELADKIVAGDSESGIWNVIKKHKPDIIVLGYDQSSLRADLEKKMTDFGRRLQIKTASAHKPDKYHSRFLNK